MGQEKKCKKKKKPRLFPWNNLWSYFFSFFTSVCLQWIMITVTVRGWYMHIARRNCSLCPSPLWYWKQGVHFKGAMLVQVRNDTAVKPRHWVELEKVRNFVYNFFFKPESYYVVMVDFELTTLPRLTLNSQPSCLSLPSTGIIDVLSCRVFVL